MILFLLLFICLAEFYFLQVMIDESLLSDDPDSYVTLTVVRSPGGKGAVQLHWTVDEKAKDDLSPLNGTLHFDEV
jgi:G-protein coupled receptor 98